MYGHNLKLLIATAGMVLSGAAAAVEPIRVLIQVVVSQQLSMIQSPDAR
jgi:hypothetical protein